MKDIALIGKARSGKDSVAQVLTEEFGYERLAFADKLKEAALEIDPVAYESAGYLYGLREMVNAYGWDSAKDIFPDVRRFLQNLGHAMRQIDPSVWIFPVLDECDEHWRSGTPVVITDCRYQNEADILRRSGFTLVRIVRPGTGGDEHVSETELDGFPVDWTISNDGDLEALARSVRTLVAVAGEC